MDVILAPKTCDKLVSIKLPQPNDGKLKQYLYDEENLKIYEVTKYSEPFRSWFLDNQFSKEGHFNILTKVDPLFIFIPQLMKYVATQFRTLHDVCSTFNSDCSSSDKLDYALSPDIDWTLVCDTKEFDDELLVRFSETKTLDWLLKKHEKTFEALKVELADQQPSVATLISYASDLIEMYIPAELGTKLKTQAKNKYTMTNSIIEKCLTSSDGNSKASRSSSEFKPAPKRTSNQPQTSKIHQAPKGSVLNFFKPKQR